MHDKLFRRFKTQVIDKAKTKTLK